MRTCTGDTVIMSGVIIDSVIHSGTVLPRLKICIEKSEISIHTTCVISDGTVIAYNDDGRNIWDRFRKHSDRGNVMIDTGGVMRASRRIEESVELHLKKDEEAYTVTGKNSGTFHIVKQPRAYLEPVEIRRSTIPDAGFGVFAIKAIDKGVYVGEYGGELLTREQAVEDVDAKIREASHLISLDSGVSSHVLDGSIRSNWPFETYINLQLVGSFFNYNEDGNNCRFIKSTNETYLNRTYVPARGGIICSTRILIKTSRDIQAGEELFVDYGQRAFEMHHAESQPAPPEPASPEPAPPEPAPPEPAPPEIAYTVDINGISITTSEDSCTKVLSVLGNKDSLIFDRYTASSIISQILRNGVMINDFKDVLYDHSVLKRYGKCLKIFKTVDCGLSVKLWTVPHELLESAVMNWPRDGTIAIACTDGCDELIGEDITPKILRAILSRKIGEEPQEMGRAPKQRSALSRKTHTKSKNLTGCLETINKKIGNEFYCDELHMLINKFYSGDVDSKLLMNDIYKQMVDFDYDLCYTYTDVYSTAVHVFRRVFDMKHTVYGLINSGTGRKINCEMYSSDAVTKLNIVISKIKGKDQCDLLYNYDWKGMLNTQKRFIDMREPNIYLANIHSGVLVQTTSERVIQEEYDSNGYCIITHRLNAVKLERKMLVTMSINVENCKHAMSYLIANDEEYRNIWTEREGWNTYRGRGPTRIDLKPECMDEIDAVKNTKDFPWIPYVRRALGLDRSAERLVLKSMGCMYALPAADGQQDQDMHTDGELQAGVKALVVLVPLVNVTDENGPTRVWPASVGLSESAAKKKLSKTLTMDAGDVLMFDYRLWHCGTVNRTSTPRPVLHFTYSNALWTRPDVNYTNKGDMPSWDTVFEKYDTKRKESDTLKMRWGDFKMNVEAQLDDMLKQKYNIDTYDTDDKLLSVARCCIFTLYINQAGVDEDRRIEDERLYNMRDALFQMIDLLYSIFSVQDICTLKTKCKDCSNVIFKTYIDYILQYAVKRYIIQNMLLKSKEHDKDEICIVGDFRYNDVMYTGRSLPLLCTHAMYDIILKASGGEVSTNMKEKFECYYDMFEMIASFNDVRSDLTMIDDMMCAMSSDETLEHVDVYKFIHKRDGFDYNPLIVIYKNAWSRVNEFFNECSIDTRKLEKSRIYDVSGEEEEEEGANEKWEIFIEWALTVVHQIDAFKEEHMEKLFTAYFYIVCILEDPLEGDEFKFKLMCNMIYDVSSKLEDIYKDTDYKWIGKVIDREGDVFFERLETHYKKWFDINVCIGTFITFLPSGSEQYCNKLINLDSITQESNIPRFTYIHIAEDYCFPANTEFQGTRCVAKTNNGNTKIHTLIALYWYLKNLSPKEPMPRDTINAFMEKMKEVDKLVTANEMHDSIDMLYWIYNIVPEIQFKDFTDVAKSSSMCYPEHLEDPDITRGGFPAFSLEMK